MKELYLKKADENLPELNEDIVIPDVPHTILEKGNDIVIDLGNHYVGYFSFNLGYVDIYIDAPVRLYVKFCETRRELDDEFSTYDGLLCESWLQEEFINIDFPGVYKMHRRYAARYIKIKVLATPKKIMLSDFKFKAVSSADVAQLKNCNCYDELKKIDSVAVNTLKNCMHRVFEDGPKRDRRLWIGDLRLEALTNYYTFNNLPLVRRCLYLFAAADTNDKGFIPGYVYENPNYVSGYWFLEDYALLFVASVCDYYNHTEDKDMFCELYPVIKKQMDAMHKTLDSDSIVTVLEGCDVFIDWCQGLEKITSLQGVYLYVLSKLADVLDIIDHEDKYVYAKRYEDAQKSAENMLYDKEKQAFINAKDNYQYSVHSAVWMILGGAVTGKNAERILLDSLNSYDSVKPFTPYMHHYVVEAMVKLNLLKEAEEYIKKYWNGMVELGADTFYEAYVPENPEFSPYKDRKINSMCHAWSCTPAYFIRKYFDNAGI
ncbi:MAG: alpha-rhamnosidase [Clostridia bacterium]|nr:alpha-rhamnosidase [Clostridia bacterium]